MALSLHPILAAAQDEAARRPICSIISSSYVADIPFDGSPLAVIITEQKTPTIVAHSNGALYCVYTDESEESVYLYYTDVDRTEWTQVEIKNFLYHTFLYPSICELSDGNLGIVFIDAHGGDRDLKYVIVDTLGVISTEAIIESYVNSTHLIDHTSLVQNAAGTYILVYEYKIVAGANYYIAKRTSANFTSWSAQSTITFTGLILTRGKYDPYLLKTSSGSIFLFFSYVTSVTAAGTEHTELYYILSTDNGVTWGTPVALTDYSSTVAIMPSNPSAVQKADGTIKLAFLERSRVLNLEPVDDPNWIYSTSCSFCLNYAYYSSVSYVHYNPATNKLYFTCRGSGNLCSIIVLNPDTWAIEDSYTTNTSPAYNSHFCVAAGSHSDDGAYSVSYKDAAFFIVNDDLETIKTYSFKNYDASGIEINLGSDAVSDAPGTICKAAFIDALAKRCYVLLADFSLYDRMITVGYVDIEEEPDIITGMYTWHEIFSSTMEYSSQEIMGLNSLFIVPEENYVIIGSISYWKGLLLVYSLTTGALIKHYNETDYPLFHYHGASGVVYQDGHIYANINYDASYGQEDRRGLMKIRISTDLITYCRPSWATLNNYGLGQILPIGNSELLIAGSHGISHYYVDSDLWGLYDSTTVEGMVPDGSSRVDCIDYDSENDRVFFGRAYVGAPTGWEGISVFYLSGARDLIKYNTGTYNGSWTWDSAQLLTQGTSENEPAITVDADNYLWLVWQNGQNADEYKLKWDMEAGDFDLTSFIPDSTEVVISWGIEQHNQLTFSLAKGYFFDPYNVLSVYSGFVAKNRKLIVQFGETVGGIDYWQDQGIFYVVSEKLVYRRGEDPIINVIAEDPRRTWPEQEVAATEYYDGINPVAMIEAIFKTHGNMVDADFDFPASLENGHSIWHQFIDTSLKTMVETIMDHYGHVAHYDVNGKFTALKITNSNPVDHIYPDTAKLVSFSPDDSFSSNINRVVVEGETRDYIEVLYPEEDIKSVSGEMGWWKGTKQLEVFFSDDQQRIVKNIRLHKIDSVSDFQIFFMSLGSITEEIIETGDTYCIIEITAPDLTAPILANLAALIALGALCSKCDGYITGFCGWCIFSMTTLLNTLLMMLGAVAHYNYEIYGFPAGREKQCLQAVWNDTELQMELAGLIVENRFDDSFCYTVASCQSVADQEGMVLQMQRKRAVFSKIAHLQDEITDTLQIIHPEGLFPFKVFVTNLRRRFQKAGRVGQGHFIDDIAGWRLDS